MFLFLKSTKTLNLFSGETRKPAETLASHRDRDPKRPTGAAEQPRSAIPTRPISAGAESEEAAECSAIFQSEFRS